MKPINREIYISVQVHDFEVKCQHNNAMGSSDVKVIMNEQMRK